MTYDDIKHGTLVINETGSAWVFFREPDGKCGAICIRLANVGRMNSMIMHAVLPQDKCRQPIHIDLVEMIEKTFKEK